MSNVGYIRVSTVEQNEARQLLGIKLDKVFVEKISGKDRERPKLKECLTYLRQSDTLYVHSLDRLARNSIDLQQIVTELMERGVTIKFVTEGWEFTKESNHMSMLLLQVFSAFAEFERKLIKERVLDGVARARLHGTKTGRPFGKPPLDMSMSPKAHTLRAQGLTIPAIEKELNISRASVYKLLRHTQ